MNKFRVRMNGHRDKFSLIGNKYLQSSLSYHIYQDHIENFGSKLENFRLGIVKQAPAVLLDRCEDYFIYTTKADIHFLNRYKVSK